MDLTGLLRRQFAAVSRSQALAAGCTDEWLEWRVRSGRWQRLLPGVYVAYTGPLARETRLWCALLWAGDDAVLCGPTAAELSGLRGFGDERVHVCIPANRRCRSRGFVVVRRSDLADGRHAQPGRLPPRTRTARSVIDTATSRPTPGQAVAVVAAAVQQRLVRASALRAVLDDLPRARYRGLLVAVLADIAGGAHSLPEVEFGRLLKTAGLPLPDRQHVRLVNGRRRYLDCYWERWRLVVEIDGSQHREVQAVWADMLRDVELVIAGDGVIRIPSWLVRADPARVADIIARALASRGWSRARAA